MFVIYTLKNVQNSQTTSKDFFEGVFMIIFHNLHLINVQNKSNNFKEFFSKVLIRATVG